MNTYRLCTRISRWSKQSRNSIVLQCPTLYISGMNPERFWEALLRERLAEGAAIALGVATGHSYVAMPRK